MAYTNIDDPSAYFQTLTYTGNGSHPRNLTNDGNSDLKPDLVWLKNRTDGGTNHVLANSSIGWDAPKGQGYPWEDGPFGGQMASDSSGAENTPNATYGYVSAALTDGFTAAAGGTNGDTANANGKNFVAWQWKANGGTTSSNTDGSITSTVQANTDAGFSIQTFTGASSGNSNWGHGLGVTPDVFIVKRRDGIGGWWGHWKGTSRTASSGNNWEYMGLHSTAAATSLSAFNANPTTITTSNDFVVASASYICYAFAEKQGYSKFGSYVGNGNANGSFIYTGFKPAFVMVKNYSNSGYNWRILDSARNTFNLTDLLLIANSTGAEFDGSTHGDNIGMDFLSNGFKQRTAHTSINGSGMSYIYMAFAENPFVTSTGIPTTAR